MSKETSIVVAIICILITAMLLFAIGVTPHDELPAAAGKSYNYYDLECVVVSCDTELLMEDATGNLWAMPVDGLGYTIGQSVVLQMDSCGTASVLDDVIISVNGGVG